MGGYSCFNRALSLVFETAPSNSEIGAKAALGAAFNGRITQGNVKGSDKTRMM